MLPATSKKKAKKASRTIKIFSRASNLSVNPLIFAKTESGKQAIRRVTKKAYVIINGIWAHRAIAASCQTTVSHTTWQVIIAANNIVCFEINLLHIPLIKRGPATRQPASFSR